MHTYVCFVFHLKYLLLCILSSPRQGPSHSARSSFSIASLYWFPCKLFIPHTHSYFHILFYTQISYEDLSYSYRVFACLLESKTIKGRKSVKPTFSPVPSHSDQSGQHVWPVREHVSEAGLHPVPRAHSCPRCVGMFRADPVSSLVFPPEMAIRFSPLPPWQLKPKNCAIRRGFSSQTGCFHLLTVWPWESYLLSLSQFLIDAT